MVAENARESTEWQGKQLRLVGPAHVEAGQDAGADEPLAPWLSRTLQVLRDLTIRDGLRVDAAAELPILRVLTETVTELAVAVGMLARRSAGAPGGSHTCFAGSSAGEEPRSAVFRRDGDYWTLGWHGEICRLRDLRGLHLIAQLLRDPGREFLALDLLTAHDAAGLKVRWSGGVEVLDARAKAEYRQRLRALQDELEDAEELGDAERLARARAEREAIAAELADAVGLGGRDRRTGADADRARCTVTHAIRRALLHIRPALPALADELRLRIRTGSYCVYVPDAAHPSHWVL